MIVEATTLPGVHLIRPERLVDARGSFARTFCAETFAAYGLPCAFTQCSASFNVSRGTLRGLHWQAAPFAEGKLVRCTRGAIFDVAVDLRPASPTRDRWVGYDLTAANGWALFIPEGVAHGFQTVSDDTEVFYQMTVAYHAELARGARWNDPRFAIDWPIANPILSERDAHHALLNA